MIIEQSILNHPKTFLSENESVSVPFSSEVLRAIRIVQYLLDDLVALREIIRPDAELVFPTISNKMLDRILSHYLGTGFDIVVDQILSVDSLNTSITMKTKNNFKNDGSISDKEISCRAIVCFDAFLITTKSVNTRQCFFHLIKLLNEISRIITPALIRYKMHGEESNKKGKRKAEEISGSEKTSVIKVYGFEDSVLGGRVLINEDASRKPFLNALHLKTLSVTESSLTTKASLTVRIVSDEYINRLITHLEAWVDNSLPFPGLAIFHVPEPVHPHEIIERRIVSSIEATLEHFKKETRHTMKNKKSVTNTALDSEDDKNSDSE